MGSFTFTSAVAKTKALAAAVNKWMTDIQTILNGNIDATNLAANAVTASKHADLSATLTTKHSATSSTVLDTAAHFTGTKNVETCLAQVAVAAGMSGGASSDLKFFGFSVHATDYSLVTAIVVPADACTKIIVKAGVTQGISQAGTTAVTAQQHVEYLIAGGAYADCLAECQCTCNTGAGGTSSAASTSMGDSIIPTAGKSTTIRFKIPVYTAGATYIPVNYWIEVSGY